MDIKGAKLLALEGAKNTIKKFSPIITMERSIIQFIKVKLRKIIINLF